MHEQEAVHEDMSQFIALLRTYPQLRSDDVEKRTFKSNNIEKMYQYLRCLVNLTYQGPTDASLWYRRCRAQGELVVQLVDKVFRWTEVPDLLRRVHDQWTAPAGAISGAVREEHAEDETTGGILTAAYKKTVRSVWQTSWRLYMELPDFVDIPEAIGVTHGAAYAAMMGETGNADRVAVGAHSADHRELNKLPRLWWPDNDFDTAMAAYLAHALALQHRRDLRWIVCPGVLILSMYLTRVRRHTVVADSHFLNANDAARMTEIQTPGRPRRRTQDSRAGSSATEGAPGIPGGSSQRHLEVAERLEQRYNACEAEWQQMMRRMCTNQDRLITILARMAGADEDAQSSSGDAHGE